MKNKTKKKAVALRMCPKIASELKRRSKLTKLAQVKIVESALEYYFAGPMAQEISEVAGSLRELVSSANSHRKASNG